MKIILKKLRCGSIFNRHRFKTLTKKINKSVEGYWSPYEVTKTCKKCGISETHIENYSTNQF